ncbi:hypothetical protein HMPREF1049_0595 [Fusobacterium necrophorum subsp. funduliforme ATCC 51357]|nr:hypothetical protein HMPREF1049_0595 [Fusobacterium necrophorum subsp. funduliforme ATCC 51357]
MFYRKRECDWVKRKSSVEIYDNIFYVFFRKNRKKEIYNRSILSQARKREISVLIF